MMLTSLGIFKLYVNLTLFFGTTNLRCKLVVISVIFISQSNPFESSYASPLYMQFKPSMHTPST